MKGGGGETKEGKNKLVFRRRFGEGKKGTKKRKDFKLPELC